MAIENRGNEMWDVLIWLNAFDYIKFSILNSVELLGKDVIEVVKRNRVCNKECGGEIARFEIKFIKPCGFLN